MKQLFENQSMVQIPHEQASQPTSPIAGANKSLYQFITMVIKMVRYNLITMISNIFPMVPNGNIAI